MAATKVHILAKELGVKSKAIVEKCQAEGLDNIKTHMSTVSAGLAATINEWFSEGEHTTVLETAERVDLKKVRVRKTKKKLAEEADAAKEAAKAEAEAKEAGDAEEEVIAKPVVEPPKMLEKPMAPEVARPVAEIYEPPKLEVVTPAGPQLEKPKPAKLSGPKVIRVEEAEKDVDIRPSRPRGGGGGRGPKPSGGGGKPVGGKKPDYNKQITTPLMPDTSGDAKGKRGKKGKKAGHGGDNDGQNKRTREKDLAERRARLEAAGGKGSRGRFSRRLTTKKDAESPKKEHKRPEKATICEPITPKDLSTAIGVKTNDIIMNLIGQGTMITANQVMPADVAEFVALEFGVELTIEAKVSMEDSISEEFENREKGELTKRATVVTMLGHVDHGKTSLLDRIREAKVADGEAGGITQHVGAYQVRWGDKKVTFLDTPGHEAFTAMRARGANMTDVVVLVVAADDGLMPQTIEAIHHAKAAGVVIIVALNKIDLPGVDINRIYGQLAEHELTPVEWGGNTEVVKTSAITGEGIEDLLEYLDYASELLELKADSTLPATGWVVEAKVTPGQGPVATLLVKEGCLKKGDVLMVGDSYGRVRTMRNASGKSLAKAVSAMPVEISGLNSVPQAGDRFYCLDNINRAKEASEQKAFFAREKAINQKQLVTLDNLFSQIEAGNIKELNLIIKADVQGSVDVLIKYLTELNTDEVKLKILHAAVGGISEGDVILANASSAIIIGFNVVADDYVSKLAEREGVDVRLYTIIYRITEDLKKAMVGLLEPEEKENQLGRLTVRDIFKVKGVGTIAGCYVTTGFVKRNSKVRLIRENIIIKDDGAIDSLKHFKDDVKEVKTGFECGIKILKYDDIKVDDVIEAYEIVKIKRTL